MNGFQRQISPSDPKQKFNHTHAWNKHGGSGGDLSFYSYFCCLSTICEHRLHYAGDVQIEPLTMCIVSVHGVHSNTVVFRKQHENYLLGLGSDCSGLALWAGSDGDGHCSLPAAPAQLHSISGPVLRVRSHKAAATALKQSSPPRAQLFLKALSLVGSPLGWSLPFAFLASSICMGINRSSEACSCWTDIEQH